MSALVIFKITNGIWRNSNGAFENFFCGIYDRYLDRSQAPEFCEQITRDIGPALFYYWPERYPNQDWNDDHVLSTEDYPNSELRALLHASEAFVADFLSRKTDERLSWNEERRVIIGQSFSEFVRLLRKEVAAREKAGEMDGIG